MSNSILPNVQTYYPTGPAPARLPPSHITMTDRFRLYELAIDRFGQPIGSLREWAVIVGLESSLYPTPIPVECR